MMKRYLYLSIFLSKRTKNICACFMAVGCGSPLVQNRSVAEHPSQLQEAWDDANNPFHFGPGYSLALDSLPLEGETPVKPWSDDYWPSFRGGIAVRWRTGLDGFDYKPPTRKELVEMTIGQRSELSPAEKFDAYRGRFDYPTVKSERRRTSKDRPAWEGLCHGWAAASLHLSEPNPVIAQGEGHLDIPFAASDIKALISYHYGTSTTLPMDFLGSRCSIAFRGEDDPRSFDPECRDINAGAFHVVLANELGRRKQAFVGDITRDLEVWNQPIYGFRAVRLETLPPSPEAASGTVQEVRFKTTMSYVEEWGPHWAAHGDAPDTGGGIDSLMNRFNTREYLYRVELNRDGVVIGGAWETFDRPDFLWRQPKAQFSGPWKMLGDLLELSHRQTVPPLDPRDSEEGPGEVVVPPPVRQ